jgi:tricorn protease
LSTPGYYRSPTIHDGLIAFVCEDDLWLVPTEGGNPRRLTSNLGVVSTPRFSPDGTLLAFAGREEGAAEVYVMAAVGGSARRLTYQGALCSVVGWLPERSVVHYASNATQPFSHAFWLWKVADDGGAPSIEPYGPADMIAYGPNGGVVIARHARRDPAWWKRYRGGTAGRLWI